MSAPAWKPRQKACRTDWPGTGSRSILRAPADIGSCVADERRLRQILFNLLSNAVGFSPSADTVTLAAERRADSVVFTVTDHGPGIAPEAKDRVFDWFETDSRGSQHRGPGLGLSLSSLVRRTAWRYSLDQICARPRDDRHLRLSGTAHCKANRGMTAIAPARWYA